MAAFRRGWQVIMENLTQTLLVFLVSVGLSIGAAIGLVVAVGLSAIPAIIVWISPYDPELAAGRDPHRIAS